LTFRSLPWIGKNGSPLNPAKPPNSNAVVGIDSMLQVPTGGPTPAGEFYVANNGGIASSASPYNSWVTRVTQNDFASNSGAGAVTLVLPDAPAGLEKVRPGQKGMPIMTIWNGAIYAARNLAVAQTIANQVVNNGGELWKCKANCTTASSWKLVLSTNNTNNTFVNRANLKAISLLQVNGNRLYIGFDNPTNGAQIYRSQAGITEIDGTTACTGGDATPDNGDGYRCFELQGSPGFGSPSENQYIISSASLRKGSQNFIYVTVGDVNLVAIKVLRQVDKLCPGFAVLPGGSQPSALRRGRTLCQWANSPWGEFFSCRVAAFYLKYRRDSVCTLFFMCVACAWHEYGLCRWQRSGNERRSQGCFTDA
jgi:hypothetical protein